MLDYYLDLADATEEEPAEHQSRWNCDGSVWLWTYEKNKPQADFERLIGRIKDGHVSAPLNALVVCLGGAPTEAVLRGFYYAGHLERRYDLRFVMAVAMENQTLPYGLGALWAGSGAKYSWKGICACATRVEKAGDREHDMYWMVGPDGSRVLMKWYALMAGDNRGIGGYAEAPDPGAVVEFIDKDSAFTARYPYSVIGAFGQGWDDLDTLNDAVVRAAKEKTDERRMVIVSNQVDFFEDFERTCGADLPSVSCSFGNEWDLYCTSMVLYVDGGGVGAGEAHGGGAARRGGVGDTRQPARSELHGRAPDGARSSLDGGRPLLGARLGRGRPGRS
jgi:alpha-mannosidase